MKNLNIQFLKKHSFLISMFFLLITPNLKSQDFGITGYQKRIWLKADELAGTLPVNGSNVTTWQDKSGNGLNFVQDGSNGVPTYSYNGFNFQPTVFWDATESDRRKLLWSNTTFTPSTSESYYVFVISKPYGCERPWAQCIIKFCSTDNLNGTNSNGGTGLFWTGKGNTTSENGAHVDRKITTGYTASNQTHFTGTDNTNGFNTNDRRYGLISWICPNNSAAGSGVFNEIWLNGRKSPYWNGTTGSNGANQDRVARGSGWLWHTSAKRIQLGQGGTNNWFPYSGDISEVLLLSRSGNNVMSTTDLQKVQSYFAIKYGLMLNPQSGNWLNSAGTSIWDVSDATYNNNVFGIGKDSGTGLNQKQSRSVENPNITAFLGTLSTLNVQNTNTTLADMQYVIFGHNGSNTQLNANIANGTPYQNGNINSSSGLNFQSGAIYKAQLTNLSTIDVKLKVGAVYMYAFVSTSDAFDPATTKIYYITNGNVQLTLDATYKYIRFAGYTTGPGGVGVDLRLWLKADDANMFTIENLSPSDPKLNSYTPPSGATMVQGVAEWRDYVRDKTYSWYNKGTNASYQQMPVFNPRSLKMNFHPAVTFYGQGNTRSSYIRCNEGIASTAKPLQHTAIFLVNNDFSSNSWVYPMSFYSEMDSWKAPQYGVEKSGSNVIGRLRVSGGLGTDRVVSGTQSLFGPGSTSILLYYLNTTSVKFRFNGKEEVVNHSYNQSQWNDFDMTKYSIISGGYDEDRTIIGDIGEVIIFEKELNATELNSLESYLAIKYGITLRPNAAPNRYHYKINNGATSIWDGTQPSGKFVTFYNRIAAVVRDDAANLNNKESHSSEDGTLLHLGVAGTKLGGNNPQLGELQDGEAVAFGHNNDFGFTSNQAQACGEFTHRFNTIWYVHKVTNGNRPVKMLVGAENNLSNNMGANAPQAIKDYYNKLNSNYEIYLIIADSPANITSGNYKAIVPMTFINGEHQCTYEFSEEDTYVTFGYKQLTTGCVGELEFNGKKTFTWNQYGATNYGTQNVNVSKGAVSLGDGLSVTGSSVVYTAGIRTLANYPRRSGSVLQLLRYSGSAGSTITTTVNFNVPVEAGFNISGIDHWAGGYEEVTIIGYCSGSPVLPKLSYAGNKNQAIYAINGNTATANKKQTAGNGNKIGMVNINFDQAVTQIVIQYRINGTVNGTLRNVFVSEISLRPVPPPPSINEDGLSFTKYSSKDSITTCETVNYIFEVSNTNCDDKMIHFQDILNPNLRWESGTLVLDSLNETRTGSINISSYGGTTSLTIDSLLVKGQKTIRFSATAYVDENYTYSGWQNFGNSARIDYMRIVNSVLSPNHLYSVDKYTLDSLTIFAAEYKDRYDEATVIVTTDKVSYSENGELTVTYTINNPNGNISNCYLYVDFNNNWQYVDNSFVAPFGVHFIYPDPTNSPYFFFAGSADGLSGFTLPNGNTVFSITMLAPALANIGYEEDGTTREHFRILHTLESNEEDYCVTASLLNTMGEKDVPFCNMNLQTLPSVSNCISVDLTQSSITAGSSLPNGTTFSYYLDINQNGIVDALENEISNPANITVSGHYLIRVINCDTLTNSINVTVKQPTISSNVIAICSGALPYIWNDTTFLVGTAPGTYNYVYHTTNVAGCDSTANLTLTVSEPYSNIITASICTGETYNLNGFNENTTGNYVQNLYTVDGCDSIVTLNLTVNPLPVAGITNNSGTTQLTCVQPSISVTATGGSTYIWSTGLGNNANASIANSGTYTVTVSDTNGCSDTESITITSDTSFPIADITNNTGSTELTCSLTSISLTATGGDTYFWSSGLGNSANASITSAGNYTVTITNTSTGCSASTGILITQNITLPPVGITNNTGTTELTCSQTSISLTATDGNSYSWSNGAFSASTTITAPGTYTVTATGVNGCTNATSIQILEDKTIPTASITNNTLTNELTCNVTSISVTASGGIGVFSYSWSGGLGNSANASITTPGNYVVTVTASNGCTSTE
ncbi:MAG: hypothetical protein LBC89_02300, partial [Bacteroidales bacterium]|nr:hypothetical protein [Bacteroidales bacterium]